VAFGGGRSEGMAWQGLASSRPLPIPAGPPKVSAILRDALRAAISLIDFPAHVRRLHATTR